MSMNRFRSRAAIALFAATSLALPFRGTAGTLYWTPVTSLNWSDPGNWTPPTILDTVYFEDLLTHGAATNAAGLVNNVVDSNFTIGAAIYNAFAVTNTANGAPGHYHNTLIPAGVGLGLAGLTGSPALRVGWDTPNFANGLVQATIEGPGSLFITNALTTVNIGEGANASGTHKALLDLSLLNSFTANVSNLWVGASAYFDRANGSLLLATNTTITTAPNPGAPGILLGRAMTNSAFGNLTLGATTVFNTDGLVVGGARSTFGANLLSFTPILPGTPLAATFALRGSAAGSTRAATFAIGDASATEYDYAAIANANGSGSGSTTPSTADFTAGTVDILATNLFVGRSAADPLPGFTSGTSAGTSYGSLIFNNGTINALSAYVGMKQGTNKSVAIGTLTARANAILTVSNDLTLSLVTNPAVTASSVTATLNVNDSALVQVGGNVTNHGGTATINLAGGTINLANGGNVNVNTLAGFGTIANSGNVIVSNTLTLGAVTATFVRPGTLNLGGNLTLPSAVATKFKIGASTTAGSGVNDLLNVGGNLTLNNNTLDLGFVGVPVAGTYDLVDYAGTRTGLFSSIVANTTRNLTFTLDQTVNNHIHVVVAGGPPATLTWSGGAAGTWDLTNTASWNNNTQKFYTLDNVVFDDTGLQPIISVPSTLTPGGITFNNNSLAYTFYAPGKITGPSGITKNGTGLVIWDPSGANDFVGPVNINQGTIQIQTTSYTSLFGATNKVVTIANGATLDVYGNTVGSGSGIGWPLTFSGTGVGGIGAITHTKPSSGPTIYTPLATLAGDALISVATAGLNLTVAGPTAPFAGVLDPAGHTLTLGGLGNLGFLNLIITNTGNFQVTAPNLFLRDMILDGPGTVTVGSSTLTLGAINGTVWSTGYVAKAISIGPGVMQALGASMLKIPVSSPISLSGALTISNAQPIRLSGVVSGSYGVTKLGTNNLILAAANTYTGPTVVSAGTLVLDTTGSVANSPLLRVDAPATLDVTAQPGAYTLPAGQTVQVDGALAGNLIVPAGTTLAGSGLCPGSVVVNGGTLTPGLIDLPRTLTVGNLTLSNALMTFELDLPTAAGGNINDLIAATQLSLPGTNVIKIVPIASLNNSGGQYTLFTYTGATLPSSVTNSLVLVSDTRYSFAFVDPATTPGAIMITVLGGRDGLVWQGGFPGAPSAWDIKTSTNWNNAGTPDTFFNGDAVVFDDTSLTNEADFFGSIRPATISLANNTVAYTFGGTGSLRTGAITNNGTAGFTIANNANNLLSGAGLFQNAGTLTFNQPTNASFTGVLNGGFGAPVNKQGTNALTLIGNSGPTFNGAINVNSGTLRAGSTNALGSGSVNVAPGATLDINGQEIDAPAIAVSGPGVGGLGAINNTGPQRTNALGNVSLNGDTTFGAQNRWDIEAGAGAPLQGNNYNLAKVGPADIWINALSDTGLGNVDIQQGRLVFAWAGTDLGNATGSITVHSNASLAFANDIAAGTKPATILPGGDIEAFALSTYPVIGANNAYAGNVNFDARGIFRVANLAGLNLSGTIQGPAGLVNADRGILTLSGSNAYAGDLTVNLGQVFIASSNALPASTTVTLSCTGIPSSDGVWLGVTNTTTPATVPLSMISYRTPSGNLTPALTGYGIGVWGGPINMVAAQTDPSQIPQVTFSASTNLVVMQAVTQSGTPNLALNINGFPGVVQFEAPLRFNGTMTMGSQGLGIDDLSQLYTTLELDAPGNAFTNMTFWRGKIIIGADNALPIGCPMTIPSFRTDNDARNIIDLHGHAQTFANFPGAAGFAGNGAAPLWIGNDNTNADASLVFTSSLTNTWYAWLLDNINTNLTNPRKLSLTVTSGGLRLANLTWANWTYGGPAGATNNTYSGATLVPGGALQVDAPVSNSTITVSGSGVLAGSGPIYSPIVIGAGGTLSPGGATTMATAIGVLTNYGGLTLLPGSRCYLEVNLTTKTNDWIAGSTIAYGGTLVITNVGAATFTNGAYVKLFSATNYIAGPVAIQPASPGAGLMWDVSHLTVDGTVHVVPLVIPVVSATALRPDGNLTFNITGSVGQSFSVRATPDVTLPLASWTVIQSGTLPTATYSFSDLAATNYPARFYRVSTP